MKTWNQSIAAWLILSMTALAYPSIGFCANPRLKAKADTKEITWHEPKIMSTPAKSIPMEAIDKDKKVGVGTWVLVGLGVAAVAALAAGGGGGGGSDDPVNPAGEKGKDQNEK